MAALSASSRLPSGEVLRLSFFDGENYHQINMMPGTPRVPVLQNSPLGRKHMNAMNSRPFAFVRTPLPPEQLKLQVEAMRWLLDLPAPVRPLKLSRQYARIVNRLAQLWSEESSCRRYLDSLMLDERGGRQGFQLEIVMELGNLLNYYDELHPVRSAPVWEWGGNTLG